MTMIKKAKFEYQSDERNYIGLLLKSSQEQPKAAVVLLPDWRGQSPLAIEHADHLIGQGCTVVIADLYGDGFNPDSPEQVGPMVQRLIEHRNKSVKALIACTRQLRKEVPAGPPIVLLGYSAGGMIALDYGRSGAEVDGIIICSSLLKTALPEMNARIQAPVLVLQGTQDQISPMETIVEIIAEMDDAENDVCFELYSQTHHAFDNPEAGTDPESRLVYSPNASKRAQRSIENFLTSICD